MSSFVIEKRQFARVGGFCAGLAECSDCGSPALWVYDFSRGRVYRPEDYKPAFDWLFRLNAESVQKQYHDDDPETDAESYQADFNEYRRKARDMWHFHPDKLPGAAAAVRSFFSCLFYQVEDPDCDAKIKGFVYRLYFAIMQTVERRTGADEACGWSDFTLD